MTWFTWSLQLLKMVCMSSLKWQWWDVSCCITAGIILNCCGTVSRSPPHMMTLPCWYWHLTSALFASLESSSIKSTTLSFLPNIAKYIPNSCKIRTLQPSYSKTMTDSTQGSSAVIDETSISLKRPNHQRQDSLEKHLQNRPDPKELKEKHILLDTNAAP